MIEPKPFELTLHVNGRAFRETVRPDMLLIDFLHQRSLTGTKFSCGVGSCGACKVAVQETADGPYMPLLACYARMASIDGLHITTVEGMSGSDGRLHPLQQEFLETYAFQCGFSTPGFLMAGFVLIEQLKAQPIYESTLPARLQEALGGHICRCTGYVRYFAAMESVIRSTPGTLLPGEPADVSAAAPRVSFRVRKRSSNDLDAKYVVGYLGSVLGDVTFDGRMAFDTCRAALKFELRSIRTGESVRDMNVCRFLFGQLLEARFELASAEPLESRFQLDQSTRGVAVPAMLRGQLTIADRSIPVSVNADVCVLSGRHLRIISHSQITVDMRELGFDIASFAAEFYLRLEPIAEISLDMQLQYTVV